MTNAQPAPSLGERSLELLESLLRINTTNPPGNEKHAAELLAEVFVGAGLEPFVCSSAPGRGNVIVRLKGTGEKPPLLLVSHLDVVPADASRWSEPPFAAHRKGDYLYGRGAIDMKNMAAMCTAILERLAYEKVSLQRDIIFAGVADEESGCRYGSHYIVDHHADLVRAEAALGEVGGFSLYLFGRRFYPIQVAEKGLVWLRAHAHADPGHGSMPDPQSSVMRIANAITRMGNSPMPLHPTAPAVQFLRALAEHLPGPLRLLLPRLADPTLGPLLLKHAIRDTTQRRQFVALLSNTVSPTVLRAGEKTNVIPGSASVEIDGRTLPGQTDQDLIRELQSRIGHDIQLETIDSQPPVVSDMLHPMFAHLCATLRRHDPEGIPIPYMIPGFTDAKAFSRLGTQCYGFSPVRFPQEDKIVFSKLYHGHDERIHIPGFQWGTQALYDAVLSWCT